MQLNSCRTLRPISYSPTAGQRPAVSFIYFPLNISCARFVLRELRDFQKSLPDGVLHTLSGDTLWRAHNMSGILLRRCVGELSNFGNKDDPSNWLKTAIKEVHKERIVCLQRLAQLFSVYMALFCFGVCHSPWVSHVMPAILITPVTFVRQNKVILASVSCINLWGFNSPD